MKQLNTKDEDAIRRATGSIKKNPIQAAKTIRYELISIAFVLLGLCIIAMSLGYVMGVS